MKLNTKRTFRLFLRHSKKYSWLLIISLISIAAVVGFEVTVPYFYKIFFDLLTSDAEASLVADKLFDTIVYIAMLGGGWWLFERVKHYAIAVFEIKIMHSLAMDCFEYLHKHSYSYFNNNFTGSLVKKVNRMIRSFENLSDRFFFDLFPLVLKITAIFAILFFVEPMIGLVMFVWTVVFMGLNYWFTLYKWKYDIARAAMDTRVTAALADTITNHANLKYFSALKYEYSRFKDIMSQWAQKTLLDWNIGLIADGIQGALMVLLEFIVFYFAIKAWKAGNLTVGDFVWIQTYVFSLFDRVWRFGRTVRDVYQGLADAEEMTLVLHKKHGVQDIKNAKHLSVVRGKIDFKKVDFSYDKDTKVISNLDLHIKPGERIALIGPSGGGKTTVTKLLLRLHDIQKGQILIDGQDIATVAQNSLRSQVSLVPQDPLLFHRSLLDNIKYGNRDASKEEIIAATKMARAHDFIMKFPKKYETFVGERGVKLSGGERQRVAIARAILANAPILILDEATSSLDSESESLIQEGLTNLMKQKTTLVIAHRLSTIMKMDRIIVFQDGCIVEQGTHADLIHSKSGLYKKLWDLQVGGYLEE